MGTSSENGVFHCSTCSTCFELSHKIFFSASIDMKWNKVEHSGTVEHFNRIDFIVVGFCDLGFYWCLKNVPLRLPAATNPTGF